MRIWGILISLLGVGAVGTGLWYWLFDDRPTVDFRTMPVERGNLVVTVSATGTLEPRALVDIGAQVQGRIIAFGKDPKSSTGMIDWNSEVEPGTVLARIDDSLYRATAESARAGLQKAKADIARLEARLLDAKEQWSRAQKLVLSDSESIQEYERHRAGLEAAQADLAMGHAGVREAEAVLKHAEDNVGYCTITSPTKGVVVDRRVNIGQTVVSSLNAPSLFLIAQDLTNMQVWASVNEADVGRVFPKQKVRFTVAAFPGEVFQGVVAARGVRRNASLTQNVVTYTVVVDIENPSKKLQPYMTANMLFEVARHDKVLKVPNAALRWWPETQQVAPAVRGAFLHSQTPERLDEEDTFGEGGTAETKGTVWVVEGNFVRPVAVKLGMSNGTATEIVSGDVKEGTAVVVGTVDRHKVRGGNPFLPQHSK